LVQRRDTARRVRVAKQAVADEVVAGRLTLRAAVEQFRQLHAEPGDGDSDPFLYQGVSGEAALCLNVLAWAGYPHRNDSGRDRSRDPALDRLRHEYQDLFGRDPGDYLLSLSGQRR